MTSFEKFGESFQTKIIHHLISDRVFSLQVLDILEPEFFTEDSYKEICRQVVSWCEKYNTTPTYDNLKTIINTKYEDEVELKYLNDAIDEIESVISVTDKKFVIEETLEFCKQQAMRNALLQSVPLLKSEKYEQIFELVKYAISAGQGKDIGHSLFDDVYERSADKRNPIKTGLPLLDKHIANGLSGGELGIVLAGTGVGKSMMLAFLAAEALKQGKKVIYYTLELNDKMLTYRLEAKFIGIPLTKILMDVDGKYRDMIGKKLKTLRETFNDKNIDIKVKSYPTKSANVNTIRNHLMTMENQGFVPDIIFIDYADLLRPSSKYDDKRHELESLAEELRGLAGELNVPVWTASQTNREGLDTSIVGLKTISESLGKAMVSDLMISIGRPPKLANAGLACYYLAKSRLGVDKVIFTGKFDTSILDFSIDKEGLDEDDLKKDDEQDKMRRGVKKVLGESNKKKSTGSLNNLLNIIDELEDEDGI